MILKCGEFFMNKSKLKFERIGGSLQLKIHSAECVKHVIELDETLWAATAIPVDKKGTLPIDFRLRFHEFTLIPFWQVIKTDFPEGTFKDKIILVGPTSEILHDIHSTPLGLMPGIIINANELLMFINNDFIKHVPLWLEFILIAIFVISITFLTYRAQAPRILFKVI